jgi:DNA repair protein RadA/Sms
MAKFRSSYVCQNCGAITQRWQGKCESCGEWNTIIEEAAALGVGGAAARSGGAGRPFPLEDLAGAARPEPRLITGLAELDRVAGGGFVSGSTTLIGGEPGIGKSTLLIQACAAVARSGGRVVYVSGEESTAQVRLRAARLGLADARVQLAAHTFVEDIVATLGSGDAPKFVVIDSIQTMWSDAIESAPGTVSQVRGSAQALIRFAKASGAALLIVGHVTKDGQIAGPRVVEHMVDAVFSFEGDGAHAFRLLRAAKNRFGATDEVGVFEMTGGGLAEVPNPSALFLADRDGGANPGAAVFAGVEGARPLLVEIQALVAPTTLGTPRRAVVGWEPSRLAMVLAVLEAHGGMKLGQYDVYLNVAGGLRIVEPAADLAAAAALISSLTGASLPRDAVYFGEIALSGAVRAVAHPGLRLKEAAKLGFAEAFAPPSSRADGEGANIAVHPLGTVATLVALIAASAVETRAARVGVSARSGVTN